MNLELRSFNINFRSKIEEDNTGILKVSGYANKTEQLSELMYDKKSNRKFRELIKKGAFKKSIKNSSYDIDFLAEHNDKLILSSTRNKSLFLNEDDEGLFFEATIVPTSWGQDYYKLIKDEILRNMSFGFIVIKDKWTYNTSKNEYLRTIEELELIEISVVRNPAYLQSNIEARGINLIKNIEVPNILLKENRKSMEKNKNDNLVNGALEQCEEKRNYISNWYSQKNVTEASLDIIAELLSISNYFSNAGEPDKVKKIAEFNSFLLQIISDYNTSLIKEENENLDESRSLDNNNEKNSNLPKDLKDAEEYLNQAKQIINNLK